MKLVHTGAVDERFDPRTSQAANYGGLLYPTTAIERDLSIATSVTFGGGLAFDRSVVQADLSFSRLLVWATGDVNPNDADGVTVHLRYQKNDGTTVVLTNATYTGAGFVKKTLGPVDVFGVAGVPAGETIVVLRLTAQKLVAATALMSAWTMWTQWLPPVV